MMRSLYSGVSGLKTHQVKMDVIGNNIANVNTVAYKSASVTFSEVMYQTTQGASGANALTGRGGINAKQIGLGVTLGATNTNITQPGATQTTGNPFDIKIKGDNFFVVNDGTSNYFTKAGAFYVDGSGNLAMTSSGYNVMGWQVDPITGAVKKDTVSPLRIMQEKNKTSPPEATLNGVCGGLIDSNNTALKSEDGYAMNLNFYDSLGYGYTAKFSVKASVTDGKYTVELKDVLNTEGDSMLTKYGKTAADLFGVPNTTTVRDSVTYDAKSKLQDGWTYAEVGGKGQYTFNDGTNPATIYEVGAAAGATPPPFTQVEAERAFGVTAGTAGVSFVAATGALTVVKETTGSTYELAFDTDKGTFVSVGGSDQNAMLNLSQLGGNFANIDIDFTTTKMFDNGGKNTISMDKGDLDGATGKGKKLGAMNGIAIDTEGKIFGTYDNGNTVLLGQIATAAFGNASGLEKVGENLYAETLNSGNFDGVGVEVTADGGNMTTGVLEMSNVDLSSEFTEMITTQRGFQANSRIITTSDTMLEELINLKR